MQTDIPYVPADHGKNAIVYLSIYIIDTQHQQLILQSFYGLCADKTDRTLLLSLKDLEYTAKF